LDLNVSNLSAERWRDRYPKLDRNPCWRLAISVCQHQRRKLRL